LFLLQLRSINHCESFHLRTRCKKIKRPFNHKEHKVGTKHTKLDSL
jgi:hypothetical protein